MELKCLNPNCKSDNVFTTGQTVEVSKAGIKSIGFVVRCRECHQTSSIQETESRAISDAAGDGEGR